MRKRLLLKLRVQSAPLIFSKIRLRRQMSLLFYASILNLIIVLVVIVVHDRYPSR